MESYTNNLTFYFFSPNICPFKSLRNNPCVLGELDWLTVQYPITAPMERYATRLIWTERLRLKSDHWVSTARSALPFITRHCTSMPFRRNPKVEPVCEHGFTARRGFGSLLDFSCCNVDELECVVERIFQLHTYMGVLHNSVESSLEWSTFSVCVIIHILRSLQPRHRVHDHCILEAQEVFRLGFPFGFCIMCVHVRVGAVKDEEEDDISSCFPGMCTGLVFLPPFANWRNLSDELH